MARTWVRNSHSPAREGRRAGAWFRGALVVGATCALAAPAPASARGKPDLVVTTLAVTPLVAGGVATVSDTTRNAGRRKAKASTTRYVFSRDEKSSKDDVKLGRRAVRALGPRKSSRGKASVRLPAGVAPGDAFVIACADAGRKLREANERNNCRASARLKLVSPLFGPVKPPDLPGGGGVPTEPTPTPSPPMPMPTPTPTPTATPSPTPTGASLSVQKTGPGTVAEGQQFDYSITVENTGASTARQVTTTDDLPSQGTFVSANPPAVPTGGTLEWELGDIPAGESRTMMVRWQAPRVAAFLFNSVQASGENADAESASVSTEVASDTTLSVDQTGPLQAAPGGEVTYVVKVSNRGDEDAAEVQLVDTLPSQGQFISSDPSGTPEAGTLTLELGDIPVRNSKTATIRWRAPGTDATLTNAVAASAANAPEESSVVQTFVDAPGGAPDLGTANSLLDRTAFLYTGPGAPQQGVAPGTIELERASLLRGSVIDRSGAGIGGARVTVLEHPEFGYTDTRADGGFDLVVNGGGQLNLSFEKDGLLPVQRTLEVDWQEEQELEPVVMSPLDIQVTQVDPGSSAEFQVIQGSEQTDVDGTRQATLLYPQGAGGEMVMPDGTTRQLANLSVRATEYTVGVDGGAAMPGTLPPNSGFTYAIEFSVDQALAQGAAKVQFDKPLINYTENFIGAPVGSPVPTGYYDREQGRWLPSQNGRVIKVLSETSGRADLDTDGDGTADGVAQYADLGITDAERDRLAALYNPPQELWRVEIAHFSPWDHNWPYGPPPGAKPPRLRWFNGEEPDPCYTTGYSFIDCENQVMGESVPVLGTDLNLVYQSSRTPGYVAGRDLNIPITGPDLPTGLKGVRLVVQIAGRRFEQRWEAPSASNPTPANPLAANISHRLVWDGMDAYGNRLQGRQIATITVSYVYEPRYYGGQEQFDESFAQFGNNSEVFSGRQACSTPGAEFFCGVILQQTVKRAIGAWDARAAVGLGGWTLDIHHAYDPGEEAVQRGDGSITRAEALPSVLRRLTRFNSGEYLTQAEVGPDGTIYTYDAFSRGISKVNADGTRTHFAGVDAGSACSPTGDGGPATQAILGCDVNGIAAAADGSVYVLVINTVYAAFVRKIAPNGIISTVAGSGVPPEYNNANGDGGPALQAKIFQGNDLEIGPDGALYISERRRDQSGLAYRARIRRIGTNGKIETIAGGGNTFLQDLGSGKPALDVRLLQPYRLDFGPDSALYIPDPEMGVVLRLGTDGILTRFAGTGSGGFGPDGVQATDAVIGDPVGVSVGLDGTVYIRSRHGRDRIRQVDGSGIIEPFVGFGTTATISSCPFPRGAEDVAGRACLDAHNYIIETHPDGGIVAADGRVALFKVTSPLAGFSPMAQLIPSEDGTELYEFTGNGRHVRTYSALTGALRYQFLYDTERRLSSIVDADGNRTRIERAATGILMAVVGPDGQRTALATNADGWLGSVSNPAGETTRLDYTTEGLLTKLTNPAGAASAYRYDAAGRLIRAETPAGSARTFARTETAEKVSVVVRTSLGHESTYQSELLATGERQRTIRSPSGAEQVTKIGEDGVQTLTTPAGTKITTTVGPDPRWGMRAPIVRSQTITTPSGKTRTLTLDRSVTLSDPNDPLRVTSLTDRLTVPTPSGPREGTTTYTASTRTITQTTPAGRRAETVLDGNFRVASITPATGMSPIQFSYGTKGRIERVQQGSLANAFAYDSLGRLASSTDASGALYRFEYDGADRLARFLPPSGNATRYTYDAAGNQTAVLMPSGAEHKLLWTVDHQDAGYDPPGGGMLTKSWDLDGSLTKQTLLDGREISFGYDTPGRPAAGTYPEAAVAMGYEGNTENLSSLSWTRAGGTPVHNLSLAHDGFLVTSLESTGTAAGKYEYAYGAQLYPTSVKLTSGSETVQDTLAYDSDGLLTTLGPFTFTRGGPEGLPSRIADSALALQLSYDDLGRPTGHTQTVTGTEKHRSMLTYNPAGLLASKTEQLTGGAQQVFGYRYDDDGQLTEVARDGEVVERYSYDANGNRESRQIGSDPVETATYDARDRLMSLGLVTYNWNDDGQLAGRGTDTFTYSARGELLRAVVGAATASYAYDGFRRRVSRTVGSDTHQYLYGNPEQPFQITAARAPNGVLTAYYYDDFGRLFAFRRGSDTYYVSTDQVGSPRLVTDASGSVVKRVDYDAYGVVVADSAPGFDLPIGFAGGLRDELTGFLNFGYRDYDPRAGRWTNRDPARFQGDQANLYAYAFNDPVQFRDPAGLGAWDIAWGVLESVGATDGIGLSGSWYRGIGAGANLKVGREGFSACVETGLGVGGGVQVETGGPAERTGVYTVLDASASFGPFSLRKGLQIDPCGEVLDSAAARVRVIGAGAIGNGLGLPPQPKLPFRGASASVKFTGRACYSSLD